MYGTISGTKRRCFMGIATQKHEPGKLFSNVPDDICNLFEKNKPNNVSRKRSD